MNFKNVLKLYEKCLNIKYKNVENNGDYAIEQISNTLYLYFQCSNGKEDWKNNLDFPVKPYKDMGIKWYCHRGFLKVWKSIKPYIENIIKDTKITKIVIVGYSHGAAIATLCHEYVWFNRPDLRDDCIEGYGFGCPRVFWGQNISKELKQRWENFHIIRNLNDIVTYMPPVSFGFHHVSQPINIGKKDKFKIRLNKLKSVDAHRPENYIYSIEQEIVN